MGYNLSIMAQTRQYAWRTLGLTNSFCPVRQFQPLNFASGKF
jgi:hypothetical protein